MRKKKDNSPPSPVLAIQVDPSLIRDDDCFGKNWELTAQECSMCSMHHVCMVYTSQNKKTEVESKLAQYTPFVDEIDFDNVPKDKLLEILKTTAYPVSQLRDVFKEFSKCKDDTTVALQVNNFIMKNGLKVNDGLVYNC